MSGPIEALVSLVKTEITSATTAVVSLFRSEIKRIDEDISAIADELAIRPKDGKDGRDGRDGIDGKDGSDGTPGADGRDGVDGVDGRDGAPGEKGDKGDQGPPGKDGKDGAPGRDGRDGNDGADGRNGSNGLDGINGKDGRDGIDGKDGTNGRDGIDGKDGKDGLDGKEGKQGRKGDKGDPGEMGPPGKDGVDGLDGKDGVDGKDGKDADIAPLEAEFKLLQGQVQAKLTQLTYAAGGGGGGSTKLLDNDDVEFKQLAEMMENGVLVFDAAKKKFVAKSLTEVMIALKDQILGGEMMYTKLIDTAGTLTYIGEAVPGTATSAYLWRIYRVDSTNDPDMEIRWADASTAFDKSWDNRASYTYS